MGSNICGNCANFKPEPDGRFFNCTSAEHAGLKYAMQVRPDTRSCDAFVPFGASPINASATPTPMPPRERSTSEERLLSEERSTSEERLLSEERSTSEERSPSGERQRLVGLRSRGRTILVVGLVIAVLLLSWLLYTCASTLLSTPAPTPTPTPTPTPIVTYYDINTGEWVVSSELACKVYSPRTAESLVIFPEQANAPPGTKFILVSATVTNASKTRQYEVWPSLFNLTDSEGRRYVYYYHRFHYSRFPDITLSLGETAMGEIVWLVPDYASGFEVSFTLDAVHTPQVIAKWKLPW